MASYQPGVTAYVGPGDDLVRPDPVFVGIDVVPVPESTTARRIRVHLDLASTSLAQQAESVARLKALGATPAQVGQGRPVPQGISAGSSPDAQST